MAALTRALQLARPIWLHRCQCQCGLMSASTTTNKTSDILAKERYDARSGEDADRKRSRLLYQSRKRGMLENGLILSSFADKYLNTFDAKQLDQYDRLINLPTNDWDIYYWATKTKPTPAEFETPVMQKLRDHLNQKVSENPELFPFHITTNKPDNSRTYAIQDEGNQRELEDFHGSDMMEQPIYRPNEDNSGLYPIGTDEVELDVDPRTIDIARPETVFSDKVIRLSRNETMVKMTQWRKDFFVKRLRRTLPAPVSLTGLGDGRNPRFWTQRMRDLMDRLASETGDKNKVNSQEDLVSSLEFSLSLVWMIENQPEIVKRDYPEVYELYHNKSELEKLKKALEEDQKKKIDNEISRFPHVISALISEEKLKIDKETSAKAKDLVGVEEDHDASGYKTFLIEGEPPKFAITGQVDEDYDKYLKHHELLQELLSKQFTTCPVEYDREAEAWRDSVWHRNYGKADLATEPSKVPCGGCGAVLHCNDPGLPGFLPKEVYTDHLEEGRGQAGLLGKKCQRCKFLDTYNVALDVNVPRADYAGLINQLRKDPAAVILLVVDLLDFPCSVWPRILDIIGPNRKVYVVGNKVDLLPKDSPNYLDRMKESLEDNLKTRLRRDGHNLQLAGVSLISAKTGYGVEHLITHLINAHEIQRNIYMVGCSNVGKSTLFNTLLQSDLCGVRDTDLITRASTSVWPGTTLSTLKFPIAKFQGWQMQLRKERLRIKERMKKTQELRLSQLTKHRQQSTPHMSILMERIDPTFKNTIPVPLAADHPMVAVVENTKGARPFDATSRRFQNHQFFHDTPGTNHHDQILDLLTSEELLRVMPRETIIPRTFSLRPLHSLFISGLARIDVLTATSFIWLTVFASNYLPIHVVETDQAERFYYTYLGSRYLGVPMGNENRLKSWPTLHSSLQDHIFELQADSNGWRHGLADIVLSNAGWVLVGMGPDQDCIVRAHTLEGRGIYLREKPLLADAARLKGERIRDTPCFKYSRFSIEQSNC